MTAQELFEIVKDWPKDAWPVMLGLDWSPRHGAFAFGVGTGWEIATGNEVAVALFRDSGLMWLMRNGDCVKMYPPDDVTPKFGVEVWTDAAWDKCIADCDAPTHLSALSAAIKATKGTP